MVTLRGACAQAEESKIKAEKTVKAKHAVKKQAEKKVAAKKAAAAAADSPKVREYTHVKPVTFVFNVEILSVCLNCVVLICFAETPSMHVARCCLRPLACMYVEYMCLHLVYALMQMCSLSA